MLDGNKQSRGKGRGGAEREGTRGNERAVEERGSGAQKWSGRRVEGKEEGGEWCGTP